MTDSDVVLVTGGAGFIGSHLVSAVLDLGVSVRVVDDFSTGLRQRLAPFRKRIELVEGSIVDVAVCSEACRGISYVFHQAAIPSVQRSVEDPRATHASCVTGTLNLLIEAQAAGVKRFVYAGSSSAYGDTEELPKHEAMATNPRSPYAVAKLAGEHYVRAFPGIFGVETVVLRYFNVFGPGQDPNSQYAAVVPRFISAALNDVSPTIFGDGEQTRDFTYVRNVVEANIRAATVEADRINGRVLNVGCGERISVNALWKEIQDLTGTSRSPEHLAPRPGDVRDSLASIEALREALAFDPSVSLRDGLQRTVEWFRSGGYR